MNLFKLPIVGCLLLVACAQTPPHSGVLPPSTAQSSATQPPVPPVEASPPLPGVELSNELLYAYLMTEIASQRGHKALAAEGSADIARKTHDPRLIRRAAQLALESGDMNRAIEALKQWQAVEPTSVVVNRTLASILLRGGKLDEAQQELFRLLDAEKTNLGPTFIQIFQLLTTYPDKQASLKMMRALAQPYAQVAEAHWSVAQMAQQANDKQLALSEVRHAGSLRPEWDMPVALEAQLLQKSAPRQALELMQRYLSRYPDMQEIRLQYAQTLLEQKLYQQARNEYQRLAKDNPDNPNHAFAVAIISLQMKDLKNAETVLKQSLEKGHLSQDTVQYYLGQLSEAQENEDQAITHYREVRRGEYQFSARLRVSYLLNKRGRLDEAREYLQQTQADNNQQRVQLVLVEAQLLRDARRLDIAYQVLQQGLTKLPNHPDLLYETAMVAEKSGKPEVFEQLMRKLIQLKPDYAHAYNALGYSLLERRERIPEAVQLVEKAMQLAPDDSAIMDSVGWGYYLSGRINESMKMLRRAFAGNPDPEIAAHLGEVLWVNGDKAEARKIWLDSAREHPGNTMLQEVIRKFIP